MRMVLEERDLWEVTSGEIKLEHCATTLDQTTFKRKSRKALAIICLTMEDSQLPLVRSAKDAFDAWSRLEGHFEKKMLQGNRSMAHCTSLEVPEPVNPNRSNTTTR
ncbi:unnamed protein product [Phytophthora fragariaefolia]|uniref:Unnamed protein product n=1 Tax=Phytophthora fragariaefolia TaxID=1490495 RepID=A0A9W7DAN5_9STRA|nr:unnamed protein product [Phytophthora fragariaefolia]